jgi:hypothetical protein
MRARFGQRFDDGHDADVIVGGSACRTGVASGLAASAEAERIYVDHGLTGTHRERAGLGEARAG